MEKIICTFSHNFRTLFSVIKRNVILRIIRVICRPEVPSYQKFKNNVTYFSEFEIS